MMKKYITPEISNIELNVNDIIQESFIDPPIQETIEALGRRGLNLGRVNASEINLVD